MAVKTTLRENIAIALQSISGNKLRAFLTAIIISIGIMALVGILTAIEGIKQYANNAFMGLGANSFTIQNRANQVTFGPGGRAKPFPAVRYDQADRFKKTFKLPASVSVNLSVSQSAVAKYGGKKTNPNITVKGTNENYIISSGYKIASGRNFSQTELEHGDNVVIIGNELKANLFNNGDPINKQLFIGNNQFRVIGVLESRGSSSQGGGDKICLIPVFKAKQITTDNNPSFEITVIIKDGAALNATVDEATALFRNIRGLNVAQPDNFTISRSDAIQEQLNGQIAALTIAGLVVSIITLLGASIGLMNIMLVSVTERTREIGLRKSLGATPTVIRKQFLIEAIVICIIGGLGGIIFGIIIGNVIAIGISGSFAVPWFWLIVSLIICTGVGLLSGYYPARKASKLDPVSALRYE